MKNRFLIIVFLVLLLAGVATVVGAPPAQEDVIPPKVVETNPFLGEELLLDQPITFYFDQAMDRASVENALSLQPDASLLGELVWQDDLTLTINPSTTWARDASLTFTLDTTATTAEGTPLADPFEITFETIGYLEVSEVLPALDQANVNADSLITVIFNRPVVPLVALEEQADLPNPLEITPATGGTGEWLNTSIYVFRPDPNLQGGTQYTVTVKAGLTDATGAILQEDFTWHFSTLKPQITDVSPGADASHLALETSISVSFSEAMNPQTTEESFQLVDAVNVSGSSGIVRGEFEWNEDFTQMTFTPSDLLALDGEYLIIVDGRVATSASGAFLAEGWTSRFYTVPYPAIVSTSPSDGEPSAPPYGGFEIYFNTRIDPDTVKDKVIIQPEPWREYDSYFYDYDFRYSLYFDTEPSTDYTITILPGIQDPYGNTIDQQMVVQYTTAPYDPEINLNVPDFIGLYSAYNANTRVFATHRNVSRLDMELYRLDLESVMQFAGDNAYDFMSTFEPRFHPKVRQWSVNVQSQPNQRRYELLLLSEQGESGISNIQCLGAPPPRMQVGDVGRVSLDDPRPLRVRSLPNLQGEIVTELQPGVQFDVIGGPICADGYIWWNITVQGSDLTGWSAEGTTDLYFIEVLERTAPAPEDINPEDYPPLPPGAYYFTMSAPETANIGYQPYEHVVLVATVNITLKMSPTQMMAWVTDLQSGQPVANVPITFYDGQMELLGRLNTNADGIALLEIPRLSTLYATRFAVVQTQEQFGFTTTNFDRGVSPWEFGVSGDFEPKDTAVYLYTDRPLYRPGQPVYFRGVLRYQDDVTFTIPQDMRQVPIIVYDPQDQIVYEDTLPLTRYGTFASEFTLDDGAALGYYRLVVDLTEGEYDYYNYFSLGFSVGEYVPPEFTVSVTPAEDAVVQGDEIEVLVEGLYFFGGAVNNAKVTWAALSQNYFFEYAGEGYYSFTDFNYDEGPGEYYGGYGEPVASGEGVTDAQGRYVITFEADLGKKTQSQEYTIEATLTDESDQQVSARATVIVHQGKVYVGLQPERYVGTAEEELGVQVITVGWDSEAIAAQEVDYKIVERRWSSVQEEDEVGRTVWTWEVEEIEISGGEGTVTTDENGQARIVFVPPNAGTYKILATSRDELGNEVRSSDFVWVSGREYVAWRQQNSNRFDLITDKDEYRVGDTAEILIASPFQGETTALITVERGSILQHEIVHLTTNSEIYRLPIEANHAPNIFVSVLIVKGVDENNSYAEFRMGLAQLTVNTEQLALNIEITPDIDIAAGEFAGPGDAVTYTIKTTNWQGEPVSAEVGISVTDLAVLSLTDPNSSTLMDYFYHQRGVSVRTSTALTVSVDKATQTIIDTIKGGGGGGGIEGIFDIRQEFVDTPGWKPDLVTDENGIGTYTLTLPDNLTTWRLDARAVTDGVDGPMLVGQATSDLLSTKPLLVRPLTPRFFIVDDTIQLGAIVNNNTGSNQTIEITMEGTGFELLEGVELTQTVEIPAKGRQRVNWDVKVLDVPAIDVTFFASGNNGEYTDASKPTATQGKPIPVYKYEVPEFVGTGGTMSDAGSRSELIALPRRFEVTQGTLTIKVDRSLAAAATEGLDYLENFPHQCVEQTVSRFLPNVITMRAFKDLGLSDPELEKNLDEAVNFGIQRLYATQKVDGGWGWFPEYPSSPIVTAYALLGLIEAREAGYSIDQEVINRAADFLRSEIDALPTPSRAADWQLNRQAFLIYAVTRAGFFQGSQASVLYGERLRMSHDALAFLALAMHTMDAQDARLPNFLSDFTTDVILSATGAHWEDDPAPEFWTTDTRSTALGLLTFVKLDPQSQLIPQIVRWLMVARNGDAWETTQETAWSVMALTEFMVASGELRPDYTFAVGLNGTEQAITDNTATPDNVKESEVLKIAVADLLADQANRLTFTRTEGQGNLYYTAHLQAFLPVPEVEAVSKGLIIDRHYYLAGAAEEDRKPLTSGKVGDTIEVVLTIIAPNDLYFVVVEDPLPSGAASIDPGLDINSILAEGPDLRRPLSYGWGWWWFGRTEFRDEKTVLYSDYLPRGTYEFRYSIRLGLPGAFNVIPPSGYEFYFPEVYGRGEGMLFTIEPNPEAEQAAD